MFVFILMIIKISPVGVVFEFVVATQGREGSKSDGIRKEDLCSCVHPYLKNNIHVFIYIIHPCDPTVVICYLIWPCDIAVRIIYLISHSTSLSYNTEIKG